MTDVPTIPGADDPYRDRLRGDEPVLHITEPYEQRAWASYLDWTEGGRELGAVGRAVEQASDVAGAVGDRVRRRLDGTRLGDVLDDGRDRAAAAWSSDRVQQVVTATLDTMESGYERAVAQSLAGIDPDEVVHHYAAHTDRHDVEALRDLPLAVLDRNRPAFEPRFRAQFTAASGATGAVQGLSTVTGVLAAGAMATDVLASIGLAARAIAVQLAHYGYDVTRPAEHAYVLTLLQGSLAESTLERSLMTRQARSLALDLARDRGWAELNQHVLTGLARRGFRTVGERLTRRRLARVLPGLSALIGAGQGYRYGRMVLDAAHHEGRARLLRERWGSGEEAPTGDRGGGSD